ncbi:phage scaffolding protein [Clostridium scatologenes]|uniref:Putative phage scaffold protein n=1 Tax=Clostridium scatologenes TaxID=1548 RepID=A0A0E3GRD7_CLOSL|nr:phage scaffolding protein [Clostridium scatologenes]AKA70141.1 putative phage scaffold protein [Clostridium scatologenes]
MDLLQYLQKTLGEAEGKTAFDKINTDSECALLIDNKKQSNYISKEEFTKIDSERTDYKKQLINRDKQLEDLKGKATGNEELSAEIERLKSENTKVTQDYESKINQINFDTKFEKALGDYKAKNSKALKALLDMEKVKLDGDAFLGLEDQVKALKESDSYLFEIEGGTGKIGASTINNSTTNNTAVDGVKTIGGALAKAKAESMVTTESSFFK